MSDYKAVPFGMSIPISGEWASELSTLYTERIEWEKRLVRYMDLRLWHTSHPKPWHPDRPQCPLCSWTGRIHEFWHEVHEWMEEQEEANRPRCQEWTEADVSVVRHADPCTCHEDCYDDY